jgi:hypothetical protein
MNHLLRRKSAPRSITEPKLVPHQGGHHQGNRKRVATQTPRCVWTAPPISLRDDVVERIKASWVGSGGFAHLHKEDGRDKNMWRIVAEGSRRPAGVEGRVE